MRTSSASRRAAAVLIVSKQEWTSRSLESLLVPLGYRVQRVYTRAQAVTGVAGEQPDAVIIDEQLPDGDGAALCRELRADEHITPSTPVILLQSRPPTRRDRLATLQAGAWACLGDPVDPEELGGVLSAFVPARLDAEWARAAGLVDETTGLYNARGLRRRAEELGAHAARHHAPLGCVLLAPEPLPASAALLRRIGAALRATARHSDVLGRVGPAFAVLAADTNAAQARRLAERLAAAVRAEALEREATHPPVRLRAGCHGVPDFHAAAIDATELMLRATAALQRANDASAGSWVQDYA